MLFATVLAGAFEVYAAAGMLFALAFVARGVERIDPVAKDSDWAFRVFLLPGSAALWPLLLRKWIRAL